jgi:hypothetical protein
MRRFVTLALILVFSIPVGLSISGCSKANYDFCNGASAGAQEGQISSIDLEPRLYGVSLNYGSIGQIGSPSATDCKGNGVGVTRYSYGTTNINYADISPTGSICAGSWNRNTPGGVADYTTCSPPSTNLAIKPSFSATTPPTETTGASGTLNYVNASDSINGTVNISLGGGQILSGSITGTSGASAFATAFNSNSVFSNNGIVADAIGKNIVTVTGPIGATNTLSFASSDLTYSGNVAAAYVTASAGGAVSNAVPIFVHPIVSTVQLQGQTGCISQGTSVPLLAAVSSNVNGTSTDITALSGPLNFLPQDGTVVSINSTVIPPVATAQLPGSTIISANTSNASSPAGVFYTCPPRSITLSVPNSTSTDSITLGLNTPQALTATITDTNGNPITGLNLEYLSTSPRTVNATSAGSVSAIYPGSGAITAICQPSTCNSAPLSELGVNGNGLPVTSNSIQVTTPGTVNTILYMASTTSQYFSNIDFSTATVSAPIRLPYVPNSMISDQAGTTLYFGSPSELMIVSTTSNAVTKEDASVKGTVVGVSNDGSELVISDAVHALIYIYTTSTGGSTSFGGIATHAQFSPDNQSIYITGQYPAPTTSNPNPTIVDNFFVYSPFDGWHPYLLATTPKDIAVTVPSIGAFLAGTITTERSYCPAAPAFTDFYPQVSTPQATPTDRVAVTNDSKHLLGATATGDTTGDTLADFPLTLSTGTNNPGACPNYFNLAAPASLPLGVTPVAIDGVIPDADSSIAFVTYTTNGAGTTGTKLPAYKPAASGTGTLTQVILANGASAPVSGIFSPDGQTFYTGTSGDNLVHLINVPLASTSPATADTRTIAPALPVCAVQDTNGNCTSLGTGTAVPNLLADKPRPTT